MTNDMTFSPEAEEMHAGAADYEAMRDLMSEDTREAMEEAKGNDGVGIEIKSWAVWGWVWC